MIRRYLITLAALATPFLLYWLYAVWRARAGRGATRPRDPWPTAILFLCGAVIAAETLVIAVLDEPRVRDGRYIPAHLENGRLVPAQTIPDPP